MSVNKKFECLVIPSPSFSKHELLVSEANKIANKLVINSEGKKYNEDDLLKLLNDSQADAAIIGTDPLSKKVIDKLKYLKAIGKYGVGCDNVDIEALKLKNIYFGWEGGVNRRSVSELALGMMLGHQRNIFRSIERMQRASWQKNGGVQLSEKTVGIVGFGFIGQDLAKLLAPFGCKILVHDIVDKTSECSQHSAKQVTYDELIRSSDIISFHVPGGSTTRGMYGKSEISKSKPSALIINTARGGIIDFEAMTSAVKSKKIAAYGADVFPEEPLHSKDFSIEDGFYFTPHIGGNADEAVIAMGISAVKGLQRFLSFL